ncbi:MAG TPA: ABC transporter ATP-binding protein [Bdellovibrionota bacterium]|nr:ABC transporter ATP-binding protein [Bdellovibrionota bacterium]
MSSIGTDGTSSPIIEVIEVDQCFRTGFWLNRVQILHKIDLRVPRKSITGFLGANGAGKTTLINLIVGLRRPTRGTVRVCGYEATTPEARSRLGYLPERPYFYDHLTGEGLLNYFGTLAGMRKQEIRARTPEVLAHVGMEHARRLELRRYSKGMLQRIGIAQALLHDPELLILDEPMSGLDPTGRKEMRELILRLAAEGRTIFFSSHVIPDVEAICDQVALIEKGKLVNCGPIGQFLARGPLQTEIAFSNLEIAKAKEIPELTTMREIPDGVRATVSSQDSAHSALEQLIAKKARILWITPIRPSLEDFFGKGGPHVS